MHKAASPASMPDDIEELLIGYVLNSLSAQEMLKVEQLLKQFPGLQRSIRQRETLFGVLAHGCPPLQAPASLRSRILAQVVPPSVVAPPVDVRQPTLSWSMLLGGLSLAVLIGLGIDNGLLRTKIAKLEQTITHLQQPHEQHFALKGTSFAPDASGQIILDLEKAQAAISIQNLPVPPAGATYQLWAGTHEKIIPCGALHPGPDRQVKVKLSIPVDEYSDKVSRLFMTQEPSGHPQQPSSILVLESAISKKLQSFSNKALVQDS